MYKSQSHPRIDEALAKHLDKMRAGDEVIAPLIFEELFDIKQGFAYYSSICDDDKDRLKAKDVDNLLRFIKILLQEAEYRKRQALQLEEGIMELDAILQRIEESVEKSRGVRGKIPRKKMLGAKGYEANEH